MAERIHNWRCFRAHQLVLLCVIALLAASCASSSTEESTEDSTGATSGDGADNASDSASSASSDTVPLTYQGTNPAPEFPPGLDWFNVSRPLSMVGDLRSKIVILDFWTQGCVNCLHVIPDLKQLEAEYPEELVVVGVHWAKFDSERTTAAIDQAVRRYGIEHPVVNDEFELLRNSYGVTAWPTLVLIDPFGNVVGSHAGEGVYDLFEPIVSIMAEEYGHNDLLDTTPLGELLQVSGALPTVLSFPGKVLADEATDRLFIADTGHHRVLIADLSGRLTAVIGSGTEGLADGDFAQAEFSRPQGMALSADGDVLYIADRENHTIRAADLTTNRVTTIAGTGEPTNAFRGGVATETEIASPWDLHLDQNVLYIAGAGRHQIWQLDLRTEQINLFAGTGAEGIIDGGRLNATLSQPSGLAAANGKLYFSDPEASAIRSISLRLDGELLTLVGEGLFSWGDEVGTFAETQLQHAIGIEIVNDNLLYVADTYNHRIKILDLEAETSAVVVGDGTSGLGDGRGEQAQLSEPSGLSATADALYIADTNNHRIRVLDLASGELSTLALSNLEIAAITMVSIAHDDVVLPPQQVTPGEVTIVADYVLPDGYKYNVDGRFTFGWSSDTGALTAIGEPLYEAMGPQTPIRFSAELDADELGEADAFVLRAQSTVFYCPAIDEAFCLVRDVTFTVPIEIVPIEIAAGQNSATNEGAVNEIVLNHVLPSAEDLEQRLSVG